MSRFGNPGPPEAIGISQRGRREFPLEDWTWSDPAAVPANRCRIHQTGALVSSTRTKSMEVWSAFGNR
jgi:hypothetical protein